MKGIARFLALAVVITSSSVLVEQKPAHAWMDFCNNTGRNIYIAYGWYENGDWNSAGWRRLRDNRCDRFWHHDLKNSGKRFYYLVRDEAGRNITPAAEQGAFCATNSVSREFRYASKSVEGFCGTQGTTLFNFSSFSTSGRNFSFTLD